MKINKIWEWVRDIFIWLLSLFGNIGLWFSKFGDWLASISPTLDAVIKVLTTLILLAYTLKIYIGLRFPILNTIFEKIRKIFGMKEKKLMTLSIAETEGEFVEEKVRTSKTLITYIVYVIRYVFRKGRDIVKKVFEKIGKFFKWIFVYNKFTILAILATLVIIASLYLRITKPELIAKYIDDGGLRIVIGFLASYVLYVVGYRGFESEGTYTIRKQGSTEIKAEKKAEKEATKKELKEIAAINKAIKPVLKEIEKVIVTGLLERRENQKIYGVLANYVNLNKGIPELTAEYIKALLGDEVYKVLLEKLDEMAQDYGLIEEVKDAQGNISYVNLIVEEIQKK